MTEAPSNSANGLTRPTYLLHSKEELRKYSRFPKLYGEMKYASNFTDTPLPLMKIPAELRVRILRLHLKLDEPIELCPETGDMDMDYKAEKANRKALSRLVRTRDLNLSLLRVSRKMSGEASQVFYGENEFRFSGINGHMVACGFVHTIGPRHSRWLASLTIAMPMWSIMRHGVIFSRCCNINSISSWHKFQERTPFTMPPGSNFYENAMVVLSKKLIKAGGLRKLSLVMPDWFLFSEGGRGQGKMFKALEKLVDAMPTLETNIVYMCGGGNGYETLTNSDLRFIRMLESRGIEDVRLAWYNSAGCWKMEDDVDVGTFDNFLARHEEQPEIEVEVKEEPI